jgi:hypothetical protein
MSNGNQNDSFVRWQAIAISQLTYAINLILGFSVATLAFGVTILLNDKFVLIGWQKFTFFLSLIILLASVAFRIWCVINRLRDFRGTTRIARKKEKGATDEELHLLRELTKSLGHRIWVLFWCWCVLNGDWSLSIGW